MENRAKLIQSSRNGKVSLKIIPGHFATNHSHINYYIDMTGIKCSHMVARETARTLSAKYENNTSVETIICLDGCEMIGAYMAEELSKSGIRSMNSNTEIYVVTPEFNVSGQMIFRDNLESMVWNKQVILLVASATTGKTINRSLECIKYYGGKINGISAIFSAIDEKQGVPVDSVFKSSDLPNYCTYNFEDCPYCKEQKKIDAIVNSYGYSKI